MNHIFFINPIAGKRKSLLMIPYIKSLFENRSDGYEIIISKYAGQITELSRNYSQKGYSKFYAVGGDGTLNELVNGVAGSECPIGIIPCGSGNDFLRSLIDSIEDNPISVLKKLIDGKTKKVDLGKLNDKYFINIASVGFDAEVANHKNKFIQLPFVSGSMAYILSIFRAIIKMHSYNLHISIDKKDSYNDKVLLMAMANGKYYGGGMMPVPHAKVDDGIMDICTVTNLSRLQVLKFFPLYKKGTHTELDFTRFNECTEITITSESPFAVNLDGEIYKMKTANFQLIKEGINFIVT